MSFHPVSVGESGPDPIPTRSYHGGTSSASCPYFLLWSIARDRKIMGESANSTLMNVLAALGYLTIIGIVINYVRQIVGL